jgi:hypothetical protein
MENSSKHKHIVAQIQLSKMDWQSTDNYPYVFQGVFQGQVVQLRLNDFPEEPICTVIADGTETDLQEFPKSWSLPRHRGES